MIVIHSQISAATSTTTALNSIHKIVNKQPKSPTRSRPVNKTSKRSSSPSPPDPIYGTRSQLSKKILCDNNVSNTKSLTKVFFYALFHSFLT